MVYVSKMLGDYIVYMHVNVHMYVKRTYLHASILMNVAACVSTTVRN